MVARPTVSCARRAVALTVRNESPHPYPPSALVAPARRGRPRPVTIPRSPLAAHEEKPMDAVRCRHIAEWWLLRVAVAATAGLPAQTRPVVGWAMAVAAFDVIRLRRRVVEENLARAFAQSMTKAQRRAVGRKCYQELAIGAMEMAAMTRMTPDALVAACPIHGVEHLDALKAAGTGAILVSGHLGNWEYLAASLSARGFPLVAVGAPMRNRSVDRWLGALRARFGMTLIRTGRGSGRASLRALREGRFLLLLVDQDARHRGIFVRFFGALASTHAGAAVLSLHTGAPIVPCRIARSGSRHDVFVYPPVAPERGASAESVRRLTQEITTTLQGWIVQHPSAWFWPHRRFKTPPPTLEAGAPLVPVCGGSHGAHPADHQA